MRAWWVRARGRVCNVRDAFGASSRWSCSLHALFSFRRVGTVSRPPTFSSIVLSRATRATTHLQPKHTKHKPTNNKKHTTTTKTKLQQHQQLLHAYTMGCGPSHHVTGRSRPSRHISTSASTYDSDRYRGGWSPASAGSGCSGCSGRSWGGCSGGYGSGGYGSD